MFKNYFLFFVSCTSRLIPTGLVLFYYQYTSIFSFNSYSMIKYLSNDIRASDVGGFMPENHARCCKGVRLGGAHEEDMADAERKHEAVEKKTALAMSTTSLGS